MLFWIFSNVSILLRAARRPHPIHEHGAWLPTSGFLSSLLSDETSYDHPPSLGFTLFSTSYVGQGGFLSSPVRIMKLLMISGDRSVASGKESAFFQTLKGLSPSFERIDILCPRVRGSRTECVFGNVFLHPATSGKLLYPFWVRKVGAKLHQTHQYDVLTVHDYPPFLNGIGARLLLRRIRIPSILEIHHIVGFPIAASLTERLGRWMTRVFIRSHAKHFSAVRTVNGEVKKQLIAWGVDAEKIKVVPSVYLDLALLRSIAEAKKTYDFIFSGRLVSNKGLLTVLHALAKVTAATLLVIGDGPMKPKAQRLSESLGIRPRVTFAGWLPTMHDVAAAMSSGSVFIQHSSSEGNPRVAVEALALGLPVITTRVGILPDVIEDGRNGLFVSGTVDDLVRAMQELFGASDRIASMSKSASEDVARFDRAVTLPAYAEFLRSFARTS